MRTRTINLTVIERWIEHSRLICGVASTLLFGRAIGGHFSIVAIGGRDRLGPRSVLSSCESTVARCEPMTSLIVTNTD